MQIFSVRCGLVFCTYFNYHTLQNNRTSFSETVTQFEHLLLIDNDVIRFPLNLKCSQQTVDTWHDENNLSEFISKFDF